MQEDNLIKIIKTSQEQKEFINLVEGLIDNNFKESSLAFGNLGKTDFEKKIISALLEEFKTANISNDKKAIGKYLDLLLVKAKKLNSVKITLAIKPGEKQTEKLIIWAEKNLPANTIFDIETNPQIIGGAIIVSPTGQLKDYSLSRKIDNIFLNQKREILSLL